MNKFLLLLICLLAFETGVSQSRTTDELIKAAENHLKDTVGEKLFDFFHLQSSSRYMYETEEGKIKYDSIKSGQILKGKLRNATLIYEFNHPEFDKLKVDKLFYVSIASDLSLSRIWQIKRIPKFIMKGELSNWLTTQEIDSIINLQTFKPSEYPLEKNLIYDINTHKLNWDIKNYQQKGNCSADYELLLIDPITGKILEHADMLMIIADCPY